MDSILRAARYITGIMGLRPNDILLSSFPRSGNTWVRFLIANYISVMFEDKLEITFPVLDKMMPEIGVSNLLEGWRYKDVPRIVKTHWAYNRRIFKKCRAIGVIRDPRDVMASYYRFLTKREHPLFRGDFQSFIRDRKYGLMSWFEHTHSWWKHWDLIIRYEELRSDTEEQFARTLRFLGVDIDREELSIIIERADIRKVADSEKYAPPEKLKNDSVFRFVGNSLSQKRDHMFSGEDIVYFCSLKEKYKVDLYS
jgi:estrone sulfotransferase